MSNDCLSMSNYHINHWDVRQKTGQIVIIDWIKYLTECKYWAGNLINKIKILIKTNKPFEIWRIDKLFFENNFKQYQIEKLFWTRWQYTHGVCMLINKFACYQYARDRAFSAADWTVWYTSKQMIEAVGQLDLKNQANDETWLNINGVT